ERQALQADMDRLLFEMLDQLQSVADAAQEDLSAEKVDSIVGTGERLAARIVAAMVRQNNIRAVAIDSQSLIITDANFGNAVPDVEASCERITQNLLPMLDRKIIPVITGFIGSTPDGRITTLGRGGSDYTASVLGSCSGADEVWIWTTVDGMMTTDPNEVDNARVISDMTYAEVGEMAYFGARVLHARMIGPLQSKKILLRIKNVFKPGQEGTLISSGAKKQPRSLKAVTVIQGIGLSADRSGPLSAITATVNEVLMSTAGSPAEVMISSQSASRSFLCFVIPTSSGPSAVRAAMDILQAELESSPITWQVEQVSLVTIIGAHLNDMQDIMAGLLGQLKGIPVLGMAQGPSNCSMSFVIPPESVYEAQARLHDYVLDHS
ncbi:MAG: aspartate kinase, partial [Chloroflexota bacterium]